MKIELDLQEGDIIVHTFGKVRKRGNIEVTQSTYLMINDKISFSHILKKNIPVKYTSK